MAKKCEKCGTAALDEQSDFCNLCGASVKEELTIKVPVCSKCKSPAPNAEVLFCNRCGTEYPPAEPEEKSPLCPRCGAAVHDTLSVFCNRCGASLHTEPVSTVRVCSRCSCPAPDKEALFCNRCGTEYTKDPLHHNPLCPRCGFLITDDQSQFCNRCGTAIHHEPVNKLPSCTKCGTMAPDAETLFCNRCGTPLGTSGPNQKSFRLVPHTATPPVSVKISKKRPVPAVSMPEDLWDPIPEEEFDMAEYPSHVPAAVTVPRKKYAHLPMIANELAGGKMRDESIVIPSTTKKYAHLPLIADELKEKKSPRIEIESPYYPPPPKEAKPGKSKKGFFDLLKK